MSKDTAPQGYWQDAQGRLIPEDQVRPIDRLRDELVRSLVGRALPIRELLTEFRSQAFADIQAFVELSAEQYNARLGGAKGNVTLLSYDGKYKVQRAIAETIIFDECLREWTEGARSEIAVLVQDAFRVDGSGNIRTGSVLGLRRLSIEDERWLSAMQAIGEAVQVMGSKTYLRLYERDDKGQYRPISLDIASVDAAGVRP